MMDPSQLLEQLTWLLEDSRSIERDMRRLAVDCPQLHATMVRAINLRTLVADVLADTRERAQSLDPDCVVCHSPLGADEQYACTECLLKVSIHDAALSRAGAK